MKVERYNWPNAQYNGLGAKPRLPAESEAPFSVPEPAVPAGRDARAIERRAPLSRTNVYHSVIPQSGLAAGTSAASVRGGRPGSEDDTTGALIAKVEKMADLLKQKGINGQIAMSVLETVPQKYAAHYIEIADGSNLVVYEMEDGQLLFAETDVGAEQFFNSFDHARTALGLNGSKLSIAALQRVFESFMGVERLKDFLLEYPGSDNISHI